ncbi:MAG TPA: penicillin-binding transpeptidase domain-containing protein [Rugosimonospora sp.]|nr:penicillin-binding transpeptidase domain-containing protein [Rugosimonospora sp.]
MRRYARLSCLFTAALLIGSAAACSSQEGPEKTVAAFTSGWAKGQFDATLPIIDANGASTTGAAVLTAMKTLAGDLAGRTPKVQAGTAKVTKNTATAPLTVSWPIATGVTWTYQSTLRLDLSKGKWRAIWEPSVFEPDLRAQDKLALRVTAAARGTIEDGTGNPMVSLQSVVYVGVQPNQVKDINALVTSLDAAFKSLGKDITLTDLPARVKAAGPTAFVDVVTLRNTDYLKIRTQIHDLPGTVFRTGQMSLALSTTFARAVLGSVDDVTKERMDAKPGKYVVGDQVGFGGLQEQYDDQLRGTSGIAVVVPGQGKDASGNPNPDRTLFHTDPVAGQPIKTTLDPKTEQAAEAALVGQANPAAIVAVRVSDGHILALANGPGASALDLALTAQVPPGSMFKTVTATNLLEAGKINVNTTVPCKQTLTVGGYTIHNAEAEQLGNVPLHTDFAKSCNTAFASLAPQLGPTGLKDTAAQLGIGVPWSIGLPAYTGSVSSGGDATEQAAAAFGQGKTLVSPVVMAGAAAAVARGQWKQPTLVLDPAPASPAPDQPALKQSTVDALHQMMREVVTGGTGVGVKNVPGDPIYGKTGTAEYDNNPAHTHSWFMGFRGDVAFAVFVDNGGMSTAAAVPIAGKFFTNLG